MVEPSANMSWLDPLDWKDLHAFEPVYDAANDIDSVERIAQVEAIAAALFQPFFETGLISFDSCPRDQATSNYMLRIHCARSMHGYADYSRHPSPQSSTDLEPSMEEWEHLLSDTATPTARKKLQSTPSPIRQPSSNFKPKRPIHPPTPMSHAKPVEKVKHSVSHTDYWAAQPALRFTLFSPCTRASLIFEIPYLACSRHRGVQSITYSRESRVG